MKDNEMRKKVTRFLMALAELYGEKMTEVRLRSYLLVLCEISEPELNLAYKKIINDPTIRKLPLPGQIRAAARPVLDDKSEAIRRLNLIKKAISSFGYPDPNGAKEWLGEVWQDVERMGGWKHLCEDRSANLNDSTIYAQKRDEVKSFVNAERSSINYEKLESNNTIRLLKENNGGGVSEKENT